MYFIQRSLDLTAAVINHGHNSNDFLSPKYIIMSHQSMSGKPLTGSKP
jgi:hypothetical protein